MEKPSYWSLTLECGVELDELITAFLFKHSCRGTYRQGDRLIGCFPSFDTAEACLEELRKSPFLKGYRFKALGIERIAIQPWDSLWKHSLKPIEVGDSLVVVAPWHKYSGDRIKIIIEPGMAFGTGHHGTTRMCLEEIEDLARRGCRSLLDVGTGTGILAIAARKLGFTEVVGVDIDPEAVTIAVENARINGVEEVRFFCKPVREVEGSFDLIAANLTAQTIKDLMDDMLRHLKGDGLLILSGILSEQKEEIEELLRQRGISCLKVRELEGWLTFLASPI